MHNRFIYIFTSLGLDGWTDQGIRFEGLCELDYDIYFLNSILPYLPTDSWISIIYANIQFKLDRRTN